MYALFLLGAVLVTAQAYSIEMIELEKSNLLAPIDIPVRVQFITQEDQRIKGSTLLQYHAALCGGCSFDGLNARFAVNLANNPWDDDTGDTVTVHAKDSSGTVIASNLIGSGTPMPDFNFTYSSKYSDLFFDVETGPAPAFVFTLSLTFDYKDRVYFPVMDCLPRWQMTAKEHAVVQNHTKGNDMGELVPVFKMATSENVKTGYLKYFRLDYCFGGSHHYNISITTVASDQKSGFASYACKKTYNGGICNVKTPYRDISGGSVNFIEMGLDGPQEYGPVQVIVRGDGRFGEYNNFTIAGSVPY